jgi:hypothetical protein
MSKKNNPNIVMTVDIRNEYLILNGVYTIADRILPSIPDKPSK